jgi:hypothetical protein
MFAGNYRLRNIARILSVVLEEQLNFNSYPKGVNMPNPNKNSMQGTLLNMTDAILMPIHSHRSPTNVRLSSKHLQLTAITRFVLERASLVP